MSIVFARQYDSFRAGGVRRRSKDIQLNRETDTDRDSVFDSLHCSRPSIIYALLKILTQVEMCVYQ